MFTETGGGLFVFKVGKILIYLVSQWEEINVFYYPVVSEDKSLVEGTRFLRR